MKARNYFIFLSFIFLLVSSAVTEDDYCPSGMRKTYVDDLNMDSYGSARRWLAATCFFHYPGSLFYKRKVLIEPRFEVHYKTTIDAVQMVEVSGEQKIYGFTIVISGYKNTISGYVGRSISGKLPPSSLQFQDIGYNNFVNALIIEFDFWKDSYDPADSSFSIRYCGTTCHSYDNQAQVTKKLTTQMYKPGQKNEWDFRLVYSDKTLILYSGPNIVLHQMSYDLEKTLGTNIAFVGFTGFMESTGQEVNIMGTFICEDNYVISKMKGQFYQNGKFYDEMDYAAGQTINYAFSFIDNQGKTVPHTYGYNIWDYSFFLTQDCDKKGSYTISKLDNYTLILSVPACTTVGKHSININEEIKGEAPKNYYNVVPGPLKNIKLVGHDGIIGAVPMKSSKDLFYLAFGDSNSGDFIQKKDLKIILDFQMTDQYGNIVKVSSPANLFTLKKINSDGSTSNVNVNIISFEIKENGNYYQMTISVSQIGTYQIDNKEYLEKPIRFDVISSEPDLKNSYCELYGYTSAPTVKIGTSLTYRCYLRNEDGNEIPINIFKQNSKYEFTCSVEKNWPESKSFDTTIEESTSSYYICKYKTTEVGNFGFIGYLRLKTTKETSKITSILNQFYVRGESSKYIIKKIFDPSTNKWIDITTNTVITYSPDSKGFITAIDLAEQDGSVLISSYGTYPSDFKIDNIKAKFYSEHDESFNFEQPKLKMITRDSKPYIGVYTNSETSTSLLFKKSSFYYNIQFTYNNIVKSSAIKYVLNIGNYKTCFHQLAEKNTKVNIDDSITIITKAGEYKIGSLILQTKDNNLYNYEIGTSNIKFELNPPESNVILRLVPQTIEGIYYVYAKSTKDYEGKATLYINDINIKVITLISETPKACYLEPENSGKTFEFVETIGKEIYYQYVGGFDNGNLAISFELLDKYKQVIESKDYFTKYPDISSEKYGSDTNYFSVSYEEKNKKFNFRDNLPYEKIQHGWVFYMRDPSCNYKYYIRYDGSKGGSPLTISNSYFKLLNNEIYINNEAFVSVIYKDQNNQLIGLQGDKLDSAKAKTVVKAKNREGNEVILNYVSTSNYELRYKALYFISGLYTITVTYDNQYDLKYEKSNELNVIDNIYNLEHSKLIMIIDDTLSEMSTKKRMLIDNKKYKPNFKLEFYSKDGLKTGYDKNIDFELEFTSETMKIPIIFQVDKSNDDFVIFNLPESQAVYFNALQRGDYNLILKDEKYNLIYPIYLPGEGDEDYSNDPDYDLSKTEINPFTIDGIAGETYTINIEFRATDLLRWNYLVVLEDFKISYSQNNLSNEEINIRYESGAKKGQVTIYFSQTKVTTDVPNYLSFTYKGQSLPKKVSIKIKCAQLDHLTKIEGPTNGNVITPPTIVFIPEDKYNNLYTDLFASSVKQEQLNGLTVGTSKDKISLTSNNYLKDKKYLIVQYLSKIPTDVVVTSEYFQNSYEYRIFSGPIDKDTTFAEIISETTEVGGEYILLINPKDLYNNNIDGLSQDHLNNFTIYYQTISGKDKEVVNNCYLTERETNNNLRQLLEQGQENGNFKSIECKTKITKSGEYQFLVNYNKDNIFCKNQCQFFIIATKPLFTNTKTLYTNKDIYLSLDKQNEVETRSIPIFEVTFYDYYMNKLEANEVNKINIGANLQGTDVKLCVINEDAKKSIRICPNSNDDNNENKWGCLGNGDDYHLIIYEINSEENKLNYPLTLTGGYSYEIALEPKELSFIAGNYEQFTLELRRQDGLLYNCDINIDKDININIGKSKDSSFRSTIAKIGSGNGNYSITIYSEKKGEYNLNVEVVDYSTQNKQNKKIDSVKYKVTPDPLPYRNNTIITAQPNPIIPYDMPIALKFLLYDKFNNSIIASDKIINTNYFTLINNKEPYKYISLNFDEKGEISLMPKYPPKKMSLNIIYNNGESTVYIFKDDIVLLIESSLDPDKTQIVSSNKEKIYVGEQLDMWIYTLDSNYKCLDNGDLHSQFTIEITGPLYSKLKYVREFEVYKTETGGDDSICHNEYQINIKNPEKDKYYYVGDYLIKVMYGGKIIKQYNQICYPLGYSKFQIDYSFNPDSISILDNPSFTVTGMDEYNNTVTEPLYEDFKISFTEDKKDTAFETNKKFELIQGTLNYQISIHKVGIHQLHIFYKGKEYYKMNKEQINLPKFRILTGPCYAEDNTNIDITSLKDAEVYEKAHFTINCYDIFKNKITKGGESFTVKTDYLSTSIQGDRIPLDNAKVIDNGDGSYNVEFIPIMKGIYYFNILIGKEKYGEEFSFDIKDFECYGDTVLCPNKRLCVKNIIQCIDPDKRCNLTNSLEKPFYCKINGEYSCAKSQTDCDCPDKYIKCDIMKYCVPKDRPDMCPSFKSVSAKCLINHLVENFDGICRSKKIGPNQRVCPIGKVLCADLSCRDNYDECVVTQVKESTLQRCIGQQTVRDALSCPSSVTCNTENEVVCPSGECVTNEIYCQGLKKCEENYPYLCQNNLCAETYDTCAPSISCGENKLLCQDNICRERC